MCELLTCNGLELFLRSGEVIEGHFLELVLARDGLCDVFNVAVGGVRQRGEKPAGVEEVDHHVHLVVAVGTAREQVLRKNE